MGKLNWWLIMNEKRLFDLRTDNDLKQEDIAKILNTTKKQKKSLEVPSVEIGHEDLETISSEVTTFIFQGEEYVQMPKNFYIREKQNLMKRLKKYEKIVNNIKQQIEKL